MRRRVVGDPGLVLVLALAVVAALPFLLRPGLPRDTDAELHVFRAAEVSASWRAGVLYPRWAPDFYYGYGYPIFNYYAPLTYHLASLFSLLPGLGIVGGVKGVFVLGLALGGLGTYLLVRDLLGAEAGVAAAAAFTFAPYVLFVDPYARGDLAEHFALGLLPGGLFLMRRLVGRGGRAALAGTAVAVAALLLSHNLLGPVGVGLLVVVFAWQVTVERRREGVGWGMLALLLGLALSAFFWLPLALELDQVQLTVVGAGHFDFRNHFVSLSELLAPSRLVDLGAVAPRYRLNLGPAQWLLAAAGAASLVRRQAARRPALLLFLVVASGMVFMVTSCSRLVWEALLPLTYLQFPWRLLGPAALATGVLAGAGTTLLPTTRWREPALGAGVALILILALPITFLHPWAADFGDTSPAGIVSFELEGKVLGTTSTGDFLPRTVETVLRPEQSLIDSYRGPGLVDKVNRATLPAGTTVEVLEHGPTHDRFVVAGQQEFVFRLYTLLFPGWHAYVDGQEVPIEPGRPEGFITFWVPAGRHEVLVRFEDTPPRVAGWWISAVGAVALGMVLVLHRRPHRAVPPVGLPTRSALWVGGVLLVSVVVRVFAVEPWHGLLRHESPPGQAQAARFQQEATLDGQVQFLGYDLPRRTVRSGEQLELVLYWRALRPLTANYQSFVHMTYPSSISWGQSDALNPGGLPTVRWPVDQYVWDVHRVQVRPGTPPGEYRLEVGLYTLADGQRLAVTGPDGSAQGETVVLDVPVRVLPARRQPGLESLELDEVVGVVFDEQVTLLGYATPTPVVGVPGYFHVALYWRSEQHHPDSLVVTVAVLDSAQEPVAMASGWPVVGRYPMALWSRGEVVRDAYAFWLGDDVEPDLYQVGVVVHRGDQPVTPGGAAGPLVELFTVEVR